MEPGSNEAYGIKLVPRLYEVKDVDIPGSVKVTLSDIFSRKKPLIKPGLSDPPVWFVSVRVERIHDASAEVDVRQP